MLYNVLSGKTMWPEQFNVKQTNDFFPDAEAEL
jgi:hypothetical protein